MAARTSRRRAAPMRRNPMEYALGASPLDYRPIGWDPGVIKRMSLIDPDAPPAPKGEFGFATTHQMEYTNPVTGRRWKKPRRLEILAPPAGTIAFLDYAIIGDPSTSDHAHAFIPYMKVRFDYQRRGLARQLVERFVDDCLRVGVKHLNFGKVLNETMWHIFEEQERAYSAGTSPMYVRAKRFF